MKICVLILFVAVIELSSALKCQATGYSWPKECPVMIHKKFGTVPACLKAIVYDEYNNPIWVQECSKLPSVEAPGGCEILRKKYKTVKECTVCQTDNCNYISGEGRKSISASIIAVVGCIILLLR